MKCGATTSTANVNWVCVREDCDGYAHYYVGTTDG